MEKNKSVMENRRGINQYIDRDVPTYELVDFSFAYPESTEKALKNIDLVFYKGDFVVISGESGSGKSTLLRQLKSVLASSGDSTGEIIFEGTSLKDVDHKTQSERIGFVLQSPDNQIVTDKVWHELAFGLESLGYDNDIITHRVSEMAAFFGIESWFYKNVNELSGGQKQLLNLASILVMNPSVLILDEPTSQLDPIASIEFINTLKKVNDELGITIIISEHRLQELLPISNFVVVMEHGRVVSQGDIKKVGNELRVQKHKMFDAMPVSMRVWAKVENDYAMPITVKEGRQWLKKVVADQGLMEKPLVEEEPLSLGKKEIPLSAVQQSDNVIEISELWFKYEKNSKDIVRGLDLDIKRGEFFAILGGNAAGKTTTLNIIAGVNKAYRGEITIKARTGLLPQNPENLFVKKTVMEDLKMMFQHAKSSKNDPSVNEQKLRRVVDITKLSHLLDRHPFDLSGGEKQRLALAKLLLIEPDILLLDEPTKGMDIGFKKEFGSILKGLQKTGITIVMVSHDVEFCANYVDRCGLFFDGRIVTAAEPKTFFVENSFYTTATNRMSRKILDHMVVSRDLIEALGGDVGGDYVESAVIPPLPKTKQDREKEASTLSFGRKIIAGVFGFISLMLLFHFTRITDLTTINGKDGLSGLAFDEMKLYGLFIVSVLIFALSISKNRKQGMDGQDGGIGVKSKDLGDRVFEERTLSKRTVVSSFLILITIPMTIFVGNHYLYNKKYYFISALVMLQTMLPFFIRFEGRKPKSREIVTIATLCAIAVAGRAAFFMLPQFKPVMAITIIAGVVFGGESGFLVGSISMLVSNMMFSQGPWTPFQMFAMGFIGFIAGVLFKKGFITKRKLSLANFGFILAILVYGGVMNLSSALTVMKEINTKIILSYYLSGLPFDIVHGIATWIFLYLGAEALIEKLDRIKVKYNLL